MRPIAGMTLVGRTGQWVVVEAAKGLVTLASVLPGAQRFTLSVDQFRTFELLNSVSGNESDFPDSAPSLA